MLSEEFKKMRHAYAVSGWGGARIERKTGYSAERWGQVVRGKVFPAKSLDNIAQKTGCDADYLGLAIFVRRIFFKLDLDV